MDKAIQYFEKERQKVLKNIQRNSVLPNYPKNNLDDLVKKERYFALAIEAISSLQSGRF